MRAEGSRALVSCQGVLKFMQKFSRVVNKGSIGLRKGSQVSLLSLFSWGVLSGREQGVIRDTEDSDPCSRHRNGDLALRLLQGFHKGFTRVPEAFLIRWATVMNMGVP